LTHIVFNPSWYVPKSIAVREILPKIKKEPDYVHSEGFKVYLITEGVRKEVDPSTIDWSDVIEYLTAWVDESNILHLRNDVYGRDR